jgi:hypothetical protein
MINAGQAFDQRGFAGSVFSQQRMDLAFAQSEIDFVQSLDAGKLYFNIFHLKNNLFRQVSTSLAKNRAVIITALSSLLIQQRFDRFSGRSD